PPLLPDKGKTLSVEANQHPPLGADPAPAAAPAKQRSKTVRVIVWVVLLLIFAAAFYFILNRKEPAQAGAAGGGGRSGRRGAAGAGPVTITEVTARKGDLGVYIDAIGTVTPVYTSSITAQANGVITAVHYREGQMVRKGDSLIDIDPRPYQAALQQAEGVLERDQNILAQTQMDVERYRAAFARNAVPKQTLDDQEKLLLQNQGTVKNDEGAVLAAKVNLSYCHITAPFDGRVGLRLVDPGNVVTANGGTILAVVTQIQPITAIFTIPEDNLSQVAPQLRQSAKLEVDAYDRSAQNKVASGTLLTLDNQIDTTTGTVKARASFVNKDLALYPNEFVNVRLLTKTLKDVTLIPSSAIQHNGSTAFVYLVQDGVAHMKVITPGVTDSGTTQIDGLNPGDVLANSSFEKLQDNTRVVLPGQTPEPSGHSTQGGGRKSRGSAS
ncbi:MAG TPA: efflux RND transporter periplasmic adaptor subunit, partial [Granulicella sp.]